ncbi:MAG: VOC family protein [Nocardioidaceae bacterium]|nr:VOC family protein [Nocardioidaceae bacterium]NUS50661.1 VOC family protein [Nocardioidaceae bacterium]
MTGNGPSRVAQLRLVVRVPDVEALVRLLRDDLGMGELARFGTDGAEAVLLETGAATIEVGNQAHTDQIDGIEVGRPTSPQLRLALEVDDTAGLTAALAERPDVRVLGAPAVTPWGSLNSRLTLADGVQVTLFEERGDEERFV